MMTSPDTFPAGCEEKIKAAPLPSVGIAVAAGIVLSRLPVFALTGLALRVALALVKPALLTLGAIKAWDLAQILCRRQNGEKPETF